MNTKIPNVVIWVQILLAHPSSAFDTHFPRRLKLVLWDNFISNLTHMLSQMLCSSVQHLLYISASHSKEKERMIFKSQILNAKKN